MVSSRNSGATTSDDDFKSSKIGYITHEFNVYVKIIKKTSIKYAKEVGKNLISFGKVIKKINLCLREIHVKFYGSYGKIISMAAKKIMCSI